MVVTQPQAPALAHPGAEGQVPCGAVQCRCCPTGSAGPQPHPTALHTWNLQPSLSLPQDSQLPVPVLPPSLWGSCNNQLPGLPSQKAASRPCPPSQTSTVPFKQPVTLVCFSSWCYTACKTINSKAEACGPVWVITGFATKALNSFAHLIITCLEHLTNPGARISGQHGWCKHQDKPSFLSGIRLL